jgi:hypothetical protein
VPSPVWIPNIAAFGGSFELSSTFKEGGERELQKDEGPTLSWTTRHLELAGVVYEATVGVVG